jgi:Tfp pilus assembly protein PilX
MAAERPPRDRQRGNSLVLALIVMSALATLGSLTVVSVQSSLKASTNDRSQTVALYAAESGAAYAMDFLRANYAVDWTTYFNVANIPFAPDPSFPTNKAQPGPGGNPFSPDQNAWFDIQFFNNRDEIGNDVDKQIIIHSTGHGPQESVAVVEWEVKLINVPPGSPPPAALESTADHRFVLIGWHVVDL